jgi:hypothetical protein
VLKFKCPSSYINKKNVCAKSLDENPEVAFLWLQRSLATNSTGVAQQYKSMFCWILAINSHTQLILECQFIWNSGKLMLQDGLQGGIIITQPVEILQSRLI